MDASINKVITIIEITLFVIITILFGLFFYLLGSRYLKLPTCTLSKATINEIRTQRKREQKFNNEKQRLKKKKLNKR